jgi:pimeloyl-ACP methyl ester carboxylesterase
MGGYAALAFVRRHALRLRGLVLADTRATPDTPEARENRGKQADKVRKEGTAAIADAFLPKLVGETTNAQNPALVARLKDIILANPPAGVVNALAGLAARADSTPTLREVRVPTLVVCGAEDTLTPVADSEALHAGIAGSRLEILPKAGHLSNLEAPGEFNAALVKFLTGVR